MLAVFIYLMHLSQENNTEDLALKEIHEVFNSYNIKFNDIACAKASEISELVTL